MTEKPPTDPAIAKHLTITPRFVRELRAMGVLPASGATLDACRDAYVAHLRAKAAGRDAQAGADRNDFKAQRTRVAREQADELALRNARQRGELVPIADVSNAVVGMIEVAKRALARIPAKLFPSDQVQKARVAEAIETALLDLSATRALPGPEGLPT